MNFKTILKSSVAVAALFAVAAPAANAEVKSGNKNSLTMSGQVVRALFHADDGASDKTFNSGGDWTQSRIRWIASGKLNENVSAGATIEMNVPLSNPANSMTLGGPGADGTQTAASTWGIRHEFVWVSHKRMGKLSLGQTNGAANGRSEADLGGTGIFARSDGDSYGSGIAFKETSGSNSSTSTVTIGAALSNLDANSRDDVIRYDSPKFGGASLALSMTGTGVGEIGLGYSRKLGGIRVSAAAGYTDFSANTASSNFGANGSISFKHDSGLSVTFAGGKLNYAGAASATANNADNGGSEDPNFFYWGVGYDAKLFGVGGTSFAVVHNKSNDVTQLTGHDDSEATSLGFQVVQKFSAIGAQIGLEYRRYEFESKNNTTANTFADVDVIALMTVFAF